MAEKIVLSNKKPLELAVDALVLVLPAEEPYAQEGYRAVDAALSGALTEHLKLSEFKVDKGSALSIPTLGRLPARHLVVVGVKSGGVEAAGALLSEAVAVGVRQTLGHKPKHVAVSAPGGVDLSAVALGAALGAYTFERYQAEKSKLAEVSLSLGRTPSAEDKKAWALGLRLARGVSLARDLVNEPPNVLYPETFAEEARKVAQRNKLGVKILDARGIEKAKMHLHYAVGKGSSHPPTFIHLSYVPKQPRGRIVFVGKGLTFDSGGLCIKPMQGMADMKSDMAGGAAVLGLMEAVSALSPSVEVHGIIGSAENMPDGNAYRPADVIGSLAGKTVEIINTDAEGRLVLADALTYAAHLQPDLVIDAATLTGATLVALGSPYSAYFTGSEAIAAAMQRAAERAGESFWRMPLIEELGEQLKSSIADLKHTGDRYGGAITAALFLREFTLGVPWVHCDIPGAVYRERPSGLHPKGGTGHAVLTFLELVKEHDKSSIVSAKGQPSRPRRGQRAARTVGSVRASKVAAGPVRRRRRKAS